MRAAIIRFVGLVVLLVVGVEWLIAGPAWGGLDDELRKTFEAWGMTSSLNAGGAYESQQRGFLSGGSLSVRVYRRPLPPLAAFSRPRFDLGCNGIDVYLGAFSYAKLDRFVQLLQQLGMSAVAGYAFKLALKTLCETCMNVLDNLENAIRQLNALTNIQPCQMSVEQFQNSWNQTVKAVADLGGAVKKAAGEVADKFEGRTRVPDPQATAGQLDQQDETRVTLNVVNAILKNAGVDLDSRKLIISAMGSYVINGNLIKYDIEPVIGLDPLVDVRQTDQIDIVNCQDDDCLSHATEPVTGLTGFKERVHAQLTSIADKLQQPANQTLSTDEVNLIAWSPEPVMRELNWRKGNAALMRAYVDDNAELIAIQLARAWIDYLAREVANNFKGLREQYPNLPLSQEDERHVIKTLRERAKTLADAAKTRLQLLLQQRKERYAILTNQGQALQEAVKSMRPQRSRLRSLTLTR